MYCLRKIRENTSSVLITIFLFVLVITLPTTMTTVNRVYGQQPDRMDLNITDSSANIKNTSEKKVQVGDIEMHTRC